MELFEIYDRKAENLVHRDLDKVNKFSEKVIDGTERKDQYVLLNRCCRHGSACLLHVDSTISGIDSAIVRGSSTFLARVDGPTSGIGSFGADQREDERVEYVDINNVQRDNADIHWKFARVKLVRELPSRDREQYR